MTDSGFDRESTLELLQFSDDLPSLPERFVKIQKVVEDPESGAADLARVIRSDQATTAMILKFANSPAFNPARIPVGELSKAIARIGSRETVHIATAMSLMYGIILPTGMANIRSFWAHAFGVAKVCEQMVRAIDPDQQHCSHECAFMTGLLHDIGRAALGMRVDFSYFERETGHLHQDELIAMEKEFYGVNHAEAGQHLLGLWAFPAEISAAVGNHHLPDSPDFLSRVCYQANLYCNKHLPERIAFDSVSQTLQDAMQNNPFDLTALSS